ncbi:type II secretion system protein E [Geobacter sp. OR-1]|uniref:GspE/PulE family protein n=1 Tax=Geobacter sp. OR-1 TaxID=1266765 RepID=UPI0005429C5D|nr:GspE/PulE family protein [Geobacter sp. OR-1]GAM08231.1 type II secretion system protein E [Geobacter sp. OR-1]
MTKQLFGELLLKNSWCDEDSIKRALDIQKGYGGRIGSILLNMGVITEDQLLETLSQQLAIPYLRSVEGIAHLHLPLDPRFLREQQIFPFAEDDSSLHILTTNPLNITTYSLLESITGKRVQPSLVREEALKQLLVSLDEELVTSGEYVNADDEIDKLKELASEAPVIKLVNSLLTKAMELNASDIHFESLRGAMKVRLRVDGILTTVEIVAQSLKLAVITRLKLISGMNIAEHRIPQDGRISMRIAGKEIDIRVSSVPTQFGESLVMRLLGKEDIDYSLESLGFFPDHIELINEVTRKTSGVFLTTGPTGSGKTTTLYAVLSRLNSDRVKIITAENPVEYEFKGISQINIRPEIDYTFASALRSILRQDPDIIMVGEIRDAETAEIAMQAALTGHLVVSTLHTNSALASITRLLDMGCEMFLLKSTIVGIMAQRLVRRLCPACSQPAPFPEEYAVRYGLDALLQNMPDFVKSPKRAVGCEICSGSGYRGRMVIAEIAPFTSELQDRFDHDKSFDDMNRIGHRTILQDGLLKVLAGLTTVEEVLRVAH